jgi:hypothetical protein
MRRATKFIGDVADAIRNTYEQVGNSITLVSLERPELSAEIGNGISDLHYKSDHSEILGLALIILTTA